MTHPDAAWVARALPPRPPNAHKGTFGTLALAAGCARYRGAAVLAAEAALCCGTGIVRLCAVEAVCAAAAARLPACTLLPLPAASGGGIRGDAAAAILAQKHTALLAGSGMGNTADAAALVKGLLEKANAPLLLDADALNALAGHLEDGADTDTARALTAALDAAPGPVVLTPHLGEMARLCGTSTGEIQADPAGAAQSYAKAHGCVVVLKSHATTVAAPGGEVYHMDLGGNPGLAKAGSGDVLAGLLAGLLAQGMQAGPAAAAAVWLHATAAAAAAEEYGYAALPIARLPAFIGRQLHSLGF